MWVVNRKLFTSNPLMRRFYSVFSLVLLSFVLVQCQKEIGFNEPEREVIKPLVPEPVTASVQGNVVDENGAAAAGVTIRVGTQTITTDQKGYFIIHNASLDKTSSLVTAEKPGYFKAYRVFSASEGFNHIMIRLVKKELVGSINSGTGGEVSLSNGSKVLIKPNSVVVESTSQSFSGIIKVYASYIDPTSPQISQNVPGSFLADNSQGGSVLLSSFGMMEVELETETGTPLQIQDGKKAELSFVIPPTLTSKAPPTIPLWIVDDVTGRWKEEGVATKTGNVYKGEVEHFTPHNVDIPFPTTLVSLTLKNPDGTKISFALVRLVFGEGVFQTFGYTNSSGYLRFPAALNQPLRLEIIDECGNMVFSKLLEPLTGPKNFGDIIITNSASFVTITGTIKNCLNAPVTNGTSIIYHGNKVYYLATNAQGQFQGTIIKCSSASNTISALGVDYNANQQSAISSPVTISPITNLGQLSACGVQTNEYVNYTLGGFSYNVTNGGMPGDTVFMGGSLLGNLLIKVGGNQSMNLTFAPFANTPGTYNVVSFFAQGYNGPTMQVLNPSSVTLTTYPSTQGGFFEGTFSGQFKDNANGPINYYNGSFRLRRNF